MEKSEVGSPDYPSPEPVRRVSAETTEILKGLSERRYTLARQTSEITNIMGRQSVDLTEDEALIPRSRRGSVFPVSAFIDDYAEANERERRASSVDLGLDKLLLGAPRLSGGTSLSTSISEAIKEDDETFLENGVLDESEHSA